MLMAGLSQLPVFNDYVSTAVLLAPVAFATHVESTAVRVMAQYDVASLFRIFGVKEFLPSTSNEVRLNE